MFSGKMKRKDFDDVYDEFAEFSLFSPATKMRRLDGEVVGFVEGNNDLAVPFEVEPVGQQVQVPAVPDTAYSGNDERALVLYKPMENPLLLSPADPTVSFRLSSDLIQGLKNNFFKAADSVVTEMDERMSKTNNCLAVVPWVPSQTAIHSCGVNDPDSHTEPMEEENGTASMEVEEFKENQVPNVVGNEGFQQWQQHCMPPTGLIPSTSNPIMWSSTSW